MRDDADGDPPGDPVAVAKAICLRLLTARARTRAELATALARRGIPEEAAAAALERLGDIGLIDDEAFAEAFVSARHRDRGLGRSALRRELQRKGVDRVLAEQAVDAVDDDAERRRAAELVTARLDAALFAGTQAARRRLIGMLARRGYSPSIAIGVVNDALRGFADPIPLDDGDGPAGDDDETADPW